MLSAHIEQSASGRFAFWQWTEEFVIFSVTNWADGKVAFV